MIWNTFSSRVVSRPATTRISIRASQPAIHSAALGLEGVRSIAGNSRGMPRGRGERSGKAAGIGDPFRICNGQICRCSDAPHRISMWERRPDRC